MATITLPDLRAHYARIAAQSRADADRAEAKGLTDLAAIDRRVADAAQAKANAITMTLRVQHLAGGSRLLSAHGGVM